ncbi:hypothetical protein IE81DRAFT_348855 [Ceraceosorus guamensis]|uniref:Uncharacterized protein n=1 Tax=Ceraceosorus guamensis TaxID=1522189 RepID=A0A316VZA9_9BASI|nr:hypothetical protein IE81DRAFT_348855 [Ceraceosorus guamensis]PWN40835.1 hypothetical protein IE81DRAFT_348855 [Ceraceosorus guamensis]
MNASPTDLDAQKLQYKIAVYSQLCFFFYGMVLWDVVSCLPRETKHIFWPELRTAFQRRQRLSLATSLLLASRIVAPILVAISLDFLGQPISCSRSYYAFCVGLAIQTGICASIFALRTSALRGAGRLLTAFLWLNVAGITGFWVAWAATWRVSQLPITDANRYSPICYDVRGPHGWTKAMFIWSLSFDVIVFLLTIDKAFGGAYKSAKSGGRWMLSFRQMSEVTRQFYTDALWYFFITVTVEIVLLVWYITHLNDNIVAGLVMVQLWLTSVIGPRVISNLKLVDKIQGSSHNAGPGHALPMSSYPGSNAAPIKTTTNSTAPDSQPRFVGVHSIGTPQVTGKGGDTAGSSYSFDASPVDAKQWSRQNQNGSPNHQPSSVSPPRESSFREVAMPPIAHAHGWSRQRSDDISYTVETIYKVS